MARRFGAATFAGVEVVSFAVMAVSGKSLRDAAVHKSGMIPIFYVEARGRLSG